MTCFRLISSLLSERALTVEVSMDGMNDGEILQSTKSVIQGLDALKSEHGRILENIGHSSDVFLSNKIEEELDLLRKSMEMIDLGIGEAQVMLQLDHHLQSLEAEKHKLRAQVRRLCQENAWLRDELGSTQKKFHECEQINASYSVQIEHLQFVKDLKQADNEEDDANIFGSCTDLFTLPSELGNGAFHSSNGYEIPTRLQTLHNLVLQYVSQGRHDVAIPLCQQSLEDLEKTSGHQHPDVATMLNILALVYCDQSKYKEAISLLHDALSIREEILGPDHPTVVATLNNLAVLYGKCNKFEKAEPLCKRALEIREKCLGPSHPDVAKQLNNLAVLYQNLGKYDEVEAHYKRAIDIYTQSLGADDPNLAKTKNNLISAYLKQQKYEEAEQLYTEVLTQDRYDAEAIIDALDII